MTEIEKRKTDNIAILKESGLFEQPENEKAEQKKLTLKSAFIQVFGETLEPLGFVKLKKTKEPCYVRIVGDGIINVITYRTLSAYKTGYKNVEILLGILSLYNPELIFLDDPTCSLYCIQGLYNSDYYRELDKGTVVKIPQISRDELNNIDMKKKKGFLSKLFGRKGLML